jgi:3-mercaptopyruvate sulfurtransferase SseA
MNTTMFASGLLETGAGLGAALLVGLLFGLFLEQAGFGSSRRLTGVFYFRDMTVVKVMFAAVVTCLVGYQYAVAFGWLAPSGVYILETWWGAQIVGGLLFGVGFVMGGFCPGTALAALASLKGDALVFLGGTLIGSVLFNELYPLVRPLYEGFHAGAVTLVDATGLTSRALTILFAVAAVVMFALSTWIEKRAGELPVPGPAEGRRNRRLALVLLLAALGTFLLKGPAPLPSAQAAGQETAPPAVSIPETGLYAEVAEGRDHADPETLAELLMAGSNEVQVIDLRSPEEFVAFHIRGARNVPLEQLAGGSDRVPRNKLVILYSNGTTHAAQAWLMLRGAGFENIRVLTDGILGFWRDCLTPPSLVAGMDEAAARKAGAAFAARRAFFLEYGDKPPAAPAAAPAPLAPAVTNHLAPAGLAQGVVATEWLAGQLGKQELKILDVRVKSTDYTAAHIPGALYLNLENIRATVDGIPNTLVPADDLARTFGRLGIGPADSVVVYSDQLRDSTLVALAFERVGQAAVAVLHGGWNAWAAEGRPSDNRVPRPKPVAYRPKDGADTFTASLDEVKRASESKKTVILDVRPVDYFAGRKTDEARAGHIPGAINREFSKDLVSGTAYWQEEPVLRKVYADMGITADTPVIVHCRTGHQASQTWYLLKHGLGLKNVKWFDGSWLAWASDPSLPVEVSP